MTLVTVEKARMVTKKKWAKSMNDPERKESNHVQVLQHLLVHAGAGKGGSIIDDMAFCICAIFSIGDMRVEAEERAESAGKFSTLPHAYMPMFFATSIKGYVF